MPGNVTRIPETQRIPVKGQQLLKDCAGKKIDLILAKSLSRFGRDALETIDQAESHFRSENIKFGMDGLERNS